MRDYTRDTDRARALDHALYGDLGAAAKAEQAERYAGVLRIERGPAAFRITFPQLSAHERGTAEAKAAWDAAKRPMADVKAIPGRTFSKVEAAWLIPIAEAASVELLAEDYGARIEAIADANAERVAELERQVAILTDERDAALRLADEYAAELERLAEAADTAYQAAALPGEDTSGAFAAAQSRAAVAA